MPIIRSPSKWIVTYDEIPASDPDVFPDYCSGWVYILTPGTAAAIVEAAQHIKFLWIDDAWVTGYIAAYLNITHQVIVFTHALFLVIVIIQSVSTKKAD